MTKQNRIRTGLVAGLSTIGAAAHAAVPEAVTTALTTAATDVGTMGGALVLVAVAGIGFAIGIKYLKKAKGAA